MRVAALLDETILAATTKYVAVQIHHDAVGLHIGWRDATSNASIALEFSSMPSSVAPTDEAGEAWEWIDSGETITGPSATAAGGVLVHLDNVRASRARLVIVTTADSDMFVYDGATDDVAG